MALVFYDHVRVGPGHVSFDITARRNVPTARSSDILGFTASFAIRSAAPWAAADRLHSSWILQLNGCDHERAHQDPLQDKNVTRSQ